MKSFMLGGFPNLSQCEGEVKHASAVIMCMHSSADLVPRNSSTASSADLVPRNNATAGLVIHNSVRTLQVPRLACDQGALRECPRSCLRWVPFGDHAVKKRMRVLHAANAAWPRDIGVTNLGRAWDRAVDIKDCYFGGFPW